MDPKYDKLVRRTTMVGTVTAAYFLLTVDYGPEPNFLDPVFFLCKNLGWIRVTATRDSPPIKNAILSAQSSAKEFILGQKKEAQQSEVKRLPPHATEKHP